MMPGTSLSWTLRGLVVLAAAAVTLSIAWALLPTSHGFVGYDYNYYMPYLLAGEQWISNNGWFSPAYFTPAFCGGMPWLANPESMVWSLPQVLFNALGPIGAIRWTFAAMAGLGAAGTWLLLRRSFRSSADAATLGAVLFLLNGFLTYRMAIGHLTYHVLGLIPLLALLILWDGGISRAFAIGIALRVTGAAAILAEMVFAGAPNFVAPTVLSVVAIILMHQLRGGWRPAPWLLLIGSCIWSIPLAAIKLVPAMIFILQYPRTYLNSGLFAGLIRMLDVIVRAFVFPGSLPDRVGLGPGRIVLGRHEFEYGLTVVPFVLLIAAAASARWKRPSHGVTWICLMVVLIFPFAISVGGPAWEHVIASIPIINNDTVMTRWWAIDIVPVIIGGSLCIDRFTSSALSRSMLLAAAAVVAMMQSADRDISYYTVGRVFPLYDPSGVIQAHAALEAGDSLPPIERIGPAMPDRHGEARAPMDGLLRGTSSLPCYESVFGYNLEWMPRNTLIPGPVDQLRNGFLNIADPRCYLDSGRANCHPGASLPEAEPAAAAALTHYRPIPWLAPSWQVVATFASCIGWGIAMLIALLAASRGVLIFAFSFRRRT